MVNGFKTIIKTYLCPHLFFYLKTLSIDNIMSEWKNNLGSEILDSYNNDTQCTG